MELAACKPKCDGKKQRRRSHSKHARVLKELLKPHVTFVPVWNLAKTILKTRKRDAPLGRIAYSAPGAAAPID
jgi:hypothetical protein